jgi:hypothetical protein
MKKGREESAMMTGYVGPVEKQTLENEYFRKVLFTGKHAQLVMMTLKPGEEIGDEVHSNVVSSFTSSRVRQHLFLQEKKNMWQKMATPP